MNNSPARRPDADTIAFSAFNGLRNDVPPVRFNGRDVDPAKRDGADLAVAVNVDIDQSGAVARRAGYTLAAAGAAHSLWADPTGTSCFVVQGGALKRLNADYSTTALRQLAGTGRVSYCAVNGLVYYTNGEDSGVVEHGADRSWGLPPPAPPGVTAAGGGALPAGRYQFTMTHVRADGQESGAPLARIVDVAADGGALVFTLAQAPPDVAARRLYLSTPNGETLYQALVCGPGAGTARYDRDTTELAVPLATALLGPPPAGQLVAYYRGRVWVAVGDTLYPSEPYAYELFNYRNYLQFDSRITLLAPLVDKESADGAPVHSGFFVGTDTSCGVLVGSAPDDFSYVPKTDYGAVLGALDYVDGALFYDKTIGARTLPMWLSTAGICIGRPDMEIENPTRTRYSFAAAGQGAALFLPGPNRFIATANF